MPNPPEPLDPRFADLPEPYRIRLEELQRKLAELGEPIPHPSDPLGQLARQRKDEIAQLYAIAGIEPPPGRPVDV